MPTYPTPPHPYPVSPTHPQPNSLAPPPLPRRPAPAQDASPPPEVLRVALREFKRLQRGSDQHPGYAMSLAYLEALAELPWARWSHQLPRPAASTSSGSAAEGAGQAPEAAAGGEAFAVQDGGAVGAAAGAPGGELSLRQVRERLDAAHYGLDRIKDRIVQVGLVLSIIGKFGECSLPW